MIRPPAARPSSEEYHARPAWSSTSLRAYRESPLLAYRRYVARTEKPEEPTLAMLEGSAVHMLLTEPERARTDLVLAMAREEKGPKGNKTIVETPCAVRRGNGWETAVAENPGKLVLPLGSYEAAHAMAAAILEPQTESAALAKALICAPGGYGEYFHEWEEDVNGVTIRFRMKADIVRMLGGMPIVVEIKSCRDASPEGFGKIYEDSSTEYHVQGHVYQRGMMTIPEVKRAVEHTNFIGPHVVTVAIHNEDPYEVCVRQVPDETLEDGRKVHEATLTRLARSIQDNVWCQPWEETGGAVTILKLPRSPWRARSKE